MKVGLLGDIHGNADALRAVLARARADGVEQLLVTGDLVGYYFEPAAVLELLSGWARHSVRGNHEDMLEQSMADEQAAQDIAQRYGPALRIALAQLNADQLGMLHALPASLTVELDGCHVLLCHGAPWSVDEYVYPDATDTVLHQCANVQADVVVMGHTHYPMLQRIAGKILVNPGSVGQPRDGRPGAHWAVLDTQTRAVEFRVEDYDRSALVKYCRERHPELPYLASILERRK